jgi:type III secretion protein D
MKQLRILTGRHAGSRLRLLGTRCTLGASEDADVQVSDWRHAPVSLTVEEGSKVVWMTTMDSEGQAAPRATALEDLVPRRFDDIVICVGPADDAAWPSDVVLLKRLLQARKKKPSSSKAASRGGSRTIAPAAVLSGLACTVLLGALVSLLTNGPKQAEAHTPAVPLQVRVAGLLAREGFNELGAQEAGRRVVVTGLVGGPSELARARALLQRFGESEVVHKYASASDLARSIADALADPSLNVRYEGNGVFLIEGAVRNVEGLRSTADRIAADVGPLVRRIDISVHELPPAERARIDAMLVSGDLRYVQTPDGTKHLMVLSPAASNPAMGR